MANLLDYLDWRGDLTMEQSPFNEVDNLILAELSFVNFRGIVPEIGGFKPRMAFINVLFPAPFSPTTQR